MIVKRRHDDRASAVNHLAWIAAAFGVPGQVSHVGRKAPGEPVPKAVGLPRLARGRETDAIETTFEYDSARALGDRETVLGGGTPV